MSTKYFVKLVLVLVLKTNMRACDFPLNELVNLTADRSSWRSSLKKKVSDFERRRILSLQDKRVQRKTGRQMYNAAMNKPINWGFIH